MLKPTEHYDTLREALNVYRLDANYSTLEECVAHVLLDVRVWAQSCGGTGSDFLNALCISVAMVIEQHEKAIQDLGNLENV